MKIDFRGSNESLLALDNAAGAVYYAGVMTRRKLGLAALFAAALAQAAVADANADFLKYLAGNDIPRLGQLVGKNARKLNLAHCMGLVLYESPQGFNRANALAAVRILVRNGADVNQTPVRFGNVAPLWILAATGGEFTSQQRVQIARHLLDNGADVDTTFGGFTPPLMAAATSGHTELVKVLVENGAFLDRRDKSDNTALIAAAREDRTGIARYLVDQGANVNLRNRDGETAASVAYDRGNLNLYNYLVLRGARDFEARPQPPPAADVRVQPSANAPQYRFSVTRDVYGIGGVYVNAAGGWVMIDGDGTSGTVNFSDPRRRQSAGTCSLAGGTLHIIYTSGPLSGQRFLYTVESAGQFSSPIEVFRR